MKIEHTIFIAHSFCNTRYEENDWSGNWMIKKVDTEIPGRYEYEMYLECIKVKSRTIFDIMIGKQPTIEKCWISEDYFRFYEELVPDVVEQHINQCQPCNEVLG